MTVEIVPDEQAEAEKQDQVRRHIQECLQVQIAAFRKDHGLSAGISVVGQQVEGHLYCVTASARNKDGMVLAHAGCVMLMDHVNDPVGVYAHSENVAVSRMLVFLGYYPDGSVHKPEMPESQSSGEAGMDIVHTPKPDVLEALRTGGTLPEERPPGNAQSEAGSLIAIHGALSMCKTETGVKNAWEQHEPDARRSLSESHLKRCRRLVNAHLARLRGDYNADQVSEFVRTLVVEESKGGDE